MKPPIYLAMVVAGPSTAQNLTRCGIKEPDDDVKIDLNEAWFSRPADISKTTTRNIDTYVHVVTTEAKKNRYSATMVQEQIAVMNTAYLPMNIQFTLLATTFTINPTWASASMSSTAEFSMKTALHNGTYSSLNLYFTSDLPDGLLGFCYFPTAAPSSKDKILDGCMCLADSMPNGTATHYNEGYTAVHETGHWFGLYHPFQGGSCSGEGDYVSDTPMEKTPTQGCPASKDTCPGSEGVDPVHNYMDYGYDSCMDEFTKGQMDRAVAIFDQRRAGY